MSRIYINDSWLFASEFKEEFLMGTVDATMREVRLPHTCQELPFNYFSEDEYHMVSAYRRVIYVPEEWNGKTVLFTVEGAAHHAELFINGTKCAEHQSGYTAFTVDLSDKLFFGSDNILLIKLDSRESLNVPPFGNVIDYMTYGGIYRDVYLEVKEKIHISDVFIKPEVTGKIVSDITVCGDISSDFTIRQTASLGGEIVTIAEATLEKNNFSIHGFVKDVKLWRLDSPTLYDIETSIFEGDRLIDTHLTRAGFRSAEFKTDGFYLNGRKIKIRGLNRHQSYAYVGYAMPQSMQEFDADILKNELGVNAVRTSHYPQSHYFIDRCDEIGLLVFTEIPGWQHIGDTLWKEQAVKNVEEMILQYRNHPSIVIWGVRINESKDDEELYTRTNALAHKVDPTRQTGGVRNFKRSQLLEDVYTYNDFIHDGINPGCEPRSRVTSDMKKPYLVTENNGHMFPTKSFDCEEHRVEHALRHARVLDAVASHEDICGSFSWCMSDYNTHKDFGSGDRICYHGVTDMFRNSKIAASVYSIQQSEKIVLEVGSTMDIGEHPASLRGKVWIFSNADSVKMYKNGRLLKEYIPKNEHFSHINASPILIDDYIGQAIAENENFSPKKAKYITKALNYIALNGYTRLTPKLIGMALKCMTVYRMSMAQIVDLYTKYVGDWGGTSTEYRFDAIQNGKVVKTVIKAPMNKMSLEIRASSHILSEKNSYDVAALRVRAVDEYGNLLHFCGEPLKISVEGPIELIGPEMTSLRGGMGGFYVKTVGKTGVASVTVSSPQIGDIKVDFEII